MSLGLLGFASPHISDEKHIKHALLKYNYGIIHMGKSGETAFFKEFVEKETAMKLQVWFESWKFSNLTYIADIRDLRFGPITYYENNVSISTMENWDFTYVNLLTRKIEFKPVNILYKMQYTLKKEEGRWMIVDIKHLEEKLIEPSETHTPLLEKDVEKPPTDLTFPQSQQKIATH